MFAGDFREKENVTFKGKYSVRTKGTVKKKNIKNLTRFKYFGCEVSCESEYLVKSGLLKLGIFVGRVIEILQIKQRQYKN